MIPNLATSVNPGSAWYEAVYTPLRDAHIARLQALARQFPTPRDRRTAEYDAARAAEDARQPSELEALLAFQMRALALPTWEAEYRFHRTRQWRFDLAWPHRSTTRRPSWAGASSA